MRKNSVLQVSELVSERSGVTWLAVLASLGSRKRCAGILEFLF